jgi:hypothetical protein
MELKGIWIGTATLLLADTNPKRAEGFVGAFAGFACSAENIVEAMKSLCREFEESGYVLIGVESMLPVHMLDRQLTDYETELVEATNQYPVQFKNVHLHKGDG